MKTTPSWRVVAALAAAMALGWGLAHWQDPPPAAAPPSPPTATPKPDPAPRKLAPWLLPFETPANEETGTTAAPATGPSAAHPSTAQGGHKDAPVEQDLSDGTPKLRVVEGFLLRSSAPGYPNWDHNTTSSATTGGFLSIEKAYLGPEDYTLEAALVPVLPAEAVQAWDGTLLANHASFAEWFADRMSLDLLPRVYVRVRGLVPAEVAALMPEEEVEPQDEKEAKLRDLDAPAHVRPTAPLPEAIRVYVLRDAVVLDYEVLSPTWLEAWKHAWPKRIEARRVFQEWLPTGQPPPLELKAAIAAAEEMLASVSVLSQDEAYDIRVGPVLDSRAGEEEEARRRITRWSRREHRSFQGSQTRAFGRELYQMEREISKRERQAAGGTRR